MPKECTTRVLGIWNGNFILTCTVSILIAILCVLLHSMHDVSMYVRECTCEYIRTCDSHVMSMHGTDRPHPSASL